MPLFSSKVRSDFSPLAANEPLFEFYDRSGRPEYDTYRALVEAWLEQMPTEKAVKLEAEMRHRSDKYAHNLCELVVHASLRAIGFKMDIHPPLQGNSNCPDFLLRNTNGHPLAYCEVTTINPPSREVGAESREAEVYEALNHVSIADDLLLGVAFDARGSANAPVRRLQRMVEDWAAANADAVRSGGYIQRVFNINDWAIEVTLFACEPRADRAGSIGISSVGAFAMDATAPANSLEGTVQRKATRYGLLNLPFIVVVFDRTETLAIHSSDFAESVAGGMFGPVMTRDTAMSDGSFRRTDKRGRGLWTPQARRDFNGVSAVLVFPRDDIWHLRSPKWQPLLARNPTARHPLPNDFLPFNELIVHELNEEVRLGRNFADLLGLPDPWPPLSALSGT